MPAFRAGREVGVDQRPLIGGRHPVDVGRKERIDFSATRHLG
jgi:hypothetical protein